MISERRLRKTKHKLYRGIGLQSYQGFQLDEHTVLCVVPHVTRSKRMIQTAEACESKPANHPMSQISYDWTDEW